MVQPYLHARDEFDDYLALIRGMVLRYLRVRAQSLMDNDGLYGDRGVSRKEVLATLGLISSVEGDLWLDEHGFPPAYEVEQQLLLVRFNIEARLRASLESDEAPPVLPLEDLRAGFSLSETELLLLVAAIAPQVDEDTARLYQFAWADVSTRRATAGFIARLVTPPDGDPALALQLLEQGQVLRDYHLIELEENPRWEPETPLLYASVKVPRRIVAQVLGLPVSQLDAPGLVLHREPLKSSDLILPEGLLKQLAAAMRHPRFRIGFFGRPGSGRRTLLRALSSEIQSPLVELELSQLPVGPELQSERFTATLTRWLALWLREARLHGAHLLVRLEPGVDGELAAAMLRAAPRLRPLLEAYAGGIIVTASGSSALSRSLFGELSELSYPSPTMEAQQGLWERALTPSLGAEGALRTAKQVAAGYCLTPGEISRTITQSLSRAQGQRASEALSAFALLDTLQKRRGQRLEGMADFRSVTLSLDDIVIPEEARQTLNQVIDYARHSERVYRQWGFAKYSPTGGGLSVLFSGPPGTGKTLAAGVLAHELQRALYRVDLSRIVDKYIGETEKNLGRIFDEAEGSQAMLLFDEADSLFAKRTSVKSSNDRYANLEVNYLLQRLESFRGVSILTTNLASSLDDAFARRIQFKVEFPMPDASLRAELWSKLLPPGAPVGVIDFERLGEDFELSGGHIRNAVFRACIRAAASNTRVETSFLWEAALNEARELGQLVTHLEMSERD
ncbi:MAG: AAA family ATPase [Myxococcota bacterium]|jgi:ATP-dependent 26S proteasome regulatory subunit|nr:AAA family ATPase [Myxococcota bacterium]